VPSVKDVSHHLRAPTDHVKLARQERCAAVLGLALVGRMALEEVAFCIKCLLDWFGRVDVTLATVHDRDAAQAQRDDAARKNIDDIGTSIPEILGSDSSAELQSITDTHIRSTFVRTPIVRVSSGSTSRAILRPSELAKSVLAGVTARIIQAGLEMHLNSTSRICFSMSLG
jgi:hypothetical protein